MFTDASALLGAAPGVPLFSAQPVLPETVPLRSAPNLASPTSSEVSVGSLNGRRTSWWQKASVAAVSALGAVASLGLMINDYVGGNSHPLVQTAAGLALGVSGVGILRALAPDETRRAITNTVKRSILPLYVIATEVGYMLHNHKTAIQIYNNVYFSAISTLTGFLTLDDILQLGTMKQQGQQEVEKGVNMLEGNAKSTRRTLLNHAAFLAGGVATLATGFFYGDDNLRSNLKTAGAALTCYSVGGALANLAWKYVEFLNKNHKIDPLQPTDHSLTLRISNAVVRFFQFGTPQLFAMAITPSSPYAAAAAGFLYGVEGQLTRTAFQYFPHPDDQTSVMQRANSIWQNRKEWIAFNSIFLALTSAWYIASLVADTGRERGAVSAMCGAFLTIAIANGVIDLKWQSQKGKILNSLYYNFLTHAPWAVGYLATLNIFNPNSTFFKSQVSWVQYASGLVTLGLYGGCVGAESWKLLRREVPEEEFTSTIAKSILTWITFNYALGKF